MFLGMSTGAFIASRVFAQAGLTGVCVMSAVAASGALALRLLPDEAGTGARA